MTQTYLVYREPKVSFNNVLRNMLVYIDATSMADALRIGEPLLVDTQRRYTAAKAQVVVTRKVFYL